MTSVQLLSPDKVLKLARRAVLVVYDRDLAISWLGPVRNEEDRDKAGESLRDCGLAVLLEARAGVLRPKGDEFVCRYVSISPEVFVYKKPRDRDQVEKLSKWLEEVAE